MKARIALGATSMAIAIAVSAVCAGAAGATATLTPATAQFGSHPIGESTGPKDYVFTVTSGEVFMTDIQINNPDWTVTHNCPGMMGVSATADTCTIQVTFTPIAVGPRGGLISTGTYMTKPPKPFGNNFGPVAEAFGAGLCSACVGPSTPLTSAAPAITPATPVTKQKCKRKHGRSASVAKRKCHKKRK